MTLWLKLRQFVIYCLVGSLNTVAGLAVVLGLSEILHVHYVLANIAGYAVGLSIAFVMHRKLTFPGAEKEAAAIRQIGPFLGVFAVGYVVQLVALVVLHKSGISNLCSQILACGVYVIVSFIGNKYLTFRISKP